MIIKDKEVMVDKKLYQQRENYLFKTKKFELTYNQIKILILIEEINIW